MPLAEYVAKHHKTHLIFDFDATLLLINLPWKTWGEQMREELLAIDSDLWEDWQHHKSISKVQNQYVAKHGDKARRVIVTHNENFERGLTGFQLNHDLLAEMRRLHPDHKKFIWSSNTRAAIDKVLSEAALAEWFDTIVSRNDVSFIKPDPEGFGLIYDPAVPKARYLMIGDANNDRLAAKAAGIDFYHIDFFNLGI